MCCILFVGDGFDDGYDVLANDGLFESFEAVGVNGDFDDVEEELIVTRLGVPLLLGDSGRGPPLRALRFLFESFLKSFLRDPAGVVGDIDGMVTEFLMPVLGGSPSLKVL